MILSEDTITPNGFSIVQNKIISKVYSLFADSISVYKNWGFYMFDEKFDEEIELRNRIEIIILASLFDILASEKKILAYQNEAREHNLKHLDRYCQQALEYCEAIKEFGTHFSKEEQIFIVYLRNQFVHSFLSVRHHNTMTVKFVENGTFKEEKNTIEHFHEITREFFERANLEQVEKEFIDRWIGISYRYSSIFMEFLGNEKVIYDAIYKGKEMKFSHLKI